LKLRQLRTVMAVAQCGSMSAAAQMLGLSQPAVTRVVGMLEDELGLVLFLRTHGGAQATEAGLLLAQAGAAAFRRLCEIEGCATDGMEAAALCFASSFARQVSDHELAALVAVGRYGSPKLAAEALGVTPTAVGRSLAMLAGRLGRPLFADRHGSGLTGWAADASARARRALNEIAGVEESLRLQGARKPVRLRIGALPASRVHLVPEATRRFTMRYAASEVSIFDGSYEALLTKLHAAEIDLIVGSIRPGNMPEWVFVEPLLEDHLVVVGKPDHPLQRLASVDWWDLRSARWVLPGKSTPIRAEFDRLVTRSAIPAPAQIVEVDSFVAARSFLLAGDWLGIFSASQVIAEERAGAMRRLPMSDLGGARKVGAMLRRGEARTEPIEQILSHLRAVAGEISLVTA
jgi:LysR family transcriptional regulator, regulator for genes of the gallate degradation pathway